MIRVQLDTRGDKKAFALTVKGHAGLSQAGQDIVCAAASIITYTLADRVFTMWKEDKLQDRPVVRLSSGDAAILCRPREEHWQEALYTFATASAGYALLSKNYPEYVRYKKLD